MAEHALEVKNLRKSFGSFQAVRDISFSLPKGRVVGLLGPNGAGKTTTIHMLMNITEPSGGSIHYFGKDFSTNRQASLQRVNFASSYNTLLSKITAFENLLVFALLYQVKSPEAKIRALAKQFDAEDILQQVYFTLSAGQRTRINLIKALINDPDVLLLDEPTASLDPDIADRVLTYIEQLKSERQISILYTSHDMDEVTRICDEVIFLDKGKIVAHDTPANLTKKITVTELRLIFKGDAALAETALKNASLTGSIHGSTISFHTDEAHIADIITKVTKEGLQIIDVEVDKPDLEDVFLEIARGGEHGR